MSERALCDLLIRQGVEAGLPVDDVVEQLATVQFPSFVNMDGYRTALFEAAEEHLRSEYESKLQALRQKLYAENAAAANGQTRATAKPGTVSEPELADVAGHVLETKTDDQAPPEPVDDGIDVFTSTEPAGASDETAIWVRDENEPAHRRYQK